MVRFLRLAFCLVVGGSAIAQDVDELVAASKKGSISSRIDAARALGKEDGRRALEALVDLMADADDGVAIKAGTLFDASFARLLNDIEERSRSQDESEERTRLLRRDIELLSDFLRYTELGEYRLRVMWDIRSPSKEVRRRLVEWLVEQGPEDLAGPDVISEWRCGNTDPDPHTRAMRLACEGQADVLVELVQDPLDNHKVILLDHLATVDFDAYRRMARTLVEDVNDARREAAIGAVADACGRGDDRANKDDVDILIQAVSDRRASIRAKALEGLVVLAPRRSFAEVSKLLSDPNPGIRKRAATAIGSIGGAGAVHVLLKATADANEEVRESACSALADVNSSASIAALHKLVKAGESTLRVAAYRALFGADSEDFVEVVLFGSESDLVAIRRLACEMLGYSKDEGVEMYMQVFLKDADSGVRKLARETLLERRSDEPPIP